MSDYQMFEAVVRDVEQITPLVKRFTLVSPTGAPLPAFSGGSHIIVQMQDGEQRYSNAYSLMSSPGDTLTVSTPNNLFAIEPQARKHLLIAGGIGITPFLSHIPELEQRQADWQLHYCFHDADNNAFVDALSAAPWRDRVNVHVSALGSRLDLPRLFADLEPGTHVYTCGPAALNEAVKAAAERHQVPASQLHFEQFILEDKSGEAFTLVLARSGREFTVPQEMTILQVIENNKAAKVECLCREGVCGTCETMILEGEADHRDQYYSDEEKASQQSMLICCSRAKGGRLVLDL